ncbi:ferrochelatase [bacterium DOLJORAL78_65_58]|nr:MAG: ferrochelatase [bacterium DOLZORAL124_64_63]PIE76018.1 MAG: ferrochelatase [bacterium DOLJORAL78_65_58]
MIKERSICYPSGHLDPHKVTGIILCGMGGPDGPDAVRPFLRNLFADPAILPVPSWLSPLLGRIISARRAPGVRERYLRISPDGVTPQLPTTRAQAEQVCELLATMLGGPFVPGMAMRYWHPFPKQTVTEMLAQGVEQFVIVPTYPQYSSATNGSTLLFVQDSLRRHARDKTCHFLPQWPELAGMIDVFAEAAIEALRGFHAAGHKPEECALLFGAHSLPQKMIDQGDPYLQQTRQTVRSVHSRVRGALPVEWVARVRGGRESLLAFQSRVGPIRWLGPELVRTVQDLAAQGVRHLHLQPVSFTCEHIETALELDIELKEDADAAGIRTFSRGAALNLDERWLRSLADTIARQAFKREVVS